MLDLYKISQFLMEKRMNDSFLLQNLLDYFTQPTDNNGVSLNMDSIT